MVIDIVASKWIAVSDLPKAASLSFANMPFIKVACNLVTQSAVLREIQFEFTIASLTMLLLQHPVPESIQF